MNLRDQGIFIVLFPQDDFNEIFKLRHNLKYEIRVIPELMIHVERENAVPGLKPQRQCADIRGLQRSRFEKIMLRHALGKAGDKRRFRFGQGQKGVILKIGQADRSRSASGWDFGMTSIVARSADSDIVQFILVVSG